MTVDLYVLCTRLLLLSLLLYISHYDAQAKEFGRKAVAASATIQDEEFSRTLVEFVKVCENVRLVLE